jgi:hypothetical protein
MICTIGNGNTPSLPAHLYRSSGANGPDPGFSGATRRIRTTTYRLKNSVPCFAKAFTAASEATREMSNEMESVPHTDRIAAMPALRGRALLLRQGGCAGFPSIRAVARTLQRRHSLLHADPAYPPPARAGQGVRAVGEMTRARRRILRPRPRVWPITEMQTQLHGQNRPQTGESRANELTMRAVAAYPGGAGKGLGTL